MAEHNLIVGLDVGTTKVAVCVGQVNEGLINILALTKTVNNGLRKGVVVDIEECVSAISGALEQAEKTAGVQLNHAVVGIGGAHIIVTSSKGVIAISRPDGEIVSSDIERVVEAARVIALPPNREILHVIPLQYIVDGQEGVKDPTGMTGLRLEVEALVIGGNTSAIKNLSKCVYQSGLQIDTLTFTQLASAKVLLNKKQRENGVMLVDFGGGTTSIAVFEEDELIHSAILPVGSLHITNDLAIGLRISLEAAEKIKIEQGCADKELIKDSEKVDLNKYDPNEDQKVDKKMIAEIIEARLNEIFGLVKDELKSIGRDGMLPAGVVLTGGGSLLGKIVPFAKEEMNLPVALGIPLLESTGAVDKTDNPVYAASIGLMFEGIEGRHAPASKTSKIQLPQNFSGVFDKVKDTLKQLLP